MDLESKRKTFQLRRQSSVISYEKYMAMKSNNGTHNRKSSTQNLKQDEDKSINIQRKTSNGIYISSSSENLHKQNEVDSRDKFSKLIKQLQCVSNTEDLSLTKQYRPNNNAPLKVQQEETKEIKANKFVVFLQYMMSEHETLLQVLVLLPLILTAFYITIIEQQPILRYTTDIS